MLAIYEPKGKALEYCERAVNLYKGCDHRCSYCYAPNAIHLQREIFAKPQPRVGIIEAIAKDAPKHKGRDVLMCFTCDPYSTCNIEHGLAAKAIRELHTAGCHVVILTKGGYRSLPDLELLGPGDKYGVTLTFDNAKDSLEWEPGAAVPEERIDMLDKAKARGISTWASLEPVIDPVQSLNLIRQTRELVDLYKIGKLNHHPLANEIDWKAFAEQAVALCRSQGSAFMLKRDLAAYLAKPE